MLADGVMLLHTIVVPSAEEVGERQLPTTMSLMRFIKLILTEIFPGDQTWVGVITPSRKACTVSTASTAPAAPDEWPNAALGAFEPTISP
jgi:cyclopropane fatty-acyl-phospholipid synthase-like methyltransferase